MREEGEGQGKGKKGKVTLSTTSSLETNLCSPKMLLIKTEASFDLNMALQF